MADLNSEIIAYLSVNNIPYTAGDYMTGQPEGQPNQILSWNTEKLGAEPTQAQLDAANTTYQAQVTADAQAKEAAKTAAVAKLTALGLTTDELKSLLA
jgi:hypothetical protein